MSLDEARSNMTLVAALLRHRFDGVVDIFLNGLHEALTLLIELALRSKNICCGDP